MRAILLSMFFLLSGCAAMQKAAAETPNPDDDAYDCEMESTTGSHIVSQTCRKQNASQRAMGQDQVIQMESHGSATSAGHP